MEKIESINHSTYNTGHNRVSYPDDIGESIVLKMAKLKRDALKGEADLGEGITFNLTIADDIYVATVFAEIDRKKVPLLTTMGAKTEVARKQMIPLLNDFVKKCKENVELGFIPPSSPVIVDYLHYGIAFRPDITRWSGDFSKQLGWYIFSPEMFMKKND